MPFIHCTQLYRSCHSQGLLESSGNAGTFDRRKMNQQGQTPGAQSGLSGSPTCSPWVTCAKVDQTLAPRPAWDFHPQAVTDMCPFSDRLPTGRGHASVLTIHCCVPCASGSGFPSRWTPNLRRLLLQGKLQQVPNRPKNFTALLLTSRLLYTQFGMALTALSRHIATFQTRRHFLRVW